MITVAIIIDRYISVDRFEYLLNVLSMQTYQDFNVVLCVDKYDGINFVKVIDLINAIGFTNERMKLRYNSRRCGYQKNLEWVLENRDSGYCIVLRNGDCFYEKETLEKVVHAIGKQQACRINAGVIILDHDLNYLRRESEDIDIYCPKDVKETVKSVACFRRLFATLKKCLRIDAPVLSRVLLGNDYVKPENLYKLNETIASEERWLSRSDFVRYQDIRNENRE